RSAGSNRDRRPDAVGGVTVDDLLGAVIERLERDTPPGLARILVAASLPPSADTAIMRRDPPTVTPAAPLAEVPRPVRATGPPVAVVAREECLGLLGARELLVVLEAPPAWNSRTRSGVRRGRSALV